MHNITQNAGGVTEFVASRTPAWHQLGIVAGKDLSVLEAGEKAGLLSWDLRKEPLVAATPADGLMAVRDKFVVIRNVAGEGARALGVVGDRYHLVPQETWLPFIEAVLDSETGEGQGAYVDAMGSLDGGRVAFATIAFEGADFAIGGHDLHKTYLTVVTSHDGSIALTAKPTTIRVVCQNTVNAALGQFSTQTYRLKHLSGAGDLTAKVKDAQTALEITFAQRAAIIAEAEALLARKVVDHTFAQIIEATFPEIKALNAGTQGMSKRSIALAQTKQEDLFGLWRGETVEGAGIGGTAYGVVQSIGEYLDHYGTVKGQAQYGSEANARAVREFVGREAVDTVKVKAHAATLALL